jgi:hypothetical protein
MIDEAAIAVLPDRIQIKPHLIEDEAPSLDGCFLPIRYSRENDAKKTEKAMHPVYHSSFDLFADGALRVYTRSAEYEETKRSEQFIYRIELNLRKILWGHNGRTIADGEDLCHALLIVRHAIKFLLVRTNEASRLIPGVVKNEVSYWQSMELAMDVWDPDLVIRRRLEWMRSPSVRRKQEFYKHTSLLDGKELDLKVYDKLEQMRDRHSMPMKKVKIIGDDPITRLEVALKRDKLTDYKKKQGQKIEFPPDMIPAMTEIAGKKRLTGFTWEQLKAIHRFYFSNLKAVYHVAAEAGAPTEHSYAAVLAAIAREHDIHPQAIYDLLTTYSGKPDDTCREIRRKMEWHIGQASELTAEELLSDEAYRNQPEVVVEGLGGCRFYVKAYGWGPICEAMSGVREIYGDSGRRNHLNPAEKPYLLW